MVNTVVFLWISAAAVTPTVPRSPSPGVGGTPEALSTLHDFGRARGLSFVALTAETTRTGRPLGLPAPAHDAAFVDVIEAELEQARTALSALEEASAVARLTRVESQLLAHPHLPQAAFLMGECLALQAQAAQEQSPARAAALDARRAALEGPRALAFGAAATIPHPGVPSELSVQGLGSEDQLELDARPLGAGRRARLLPGLHHARVWRHGHVVFATFVEVAPQQSVLELTPPRLVPCSSEDLEGAADGAPSHDIACERWAKVRDEAPGIGVALCERSRCGAFVHWQRQAPQSFAPIEVERQRGLPSWASFTIAGGVALVATGLVLWQTGAFDRGRPSAASWEFEGWSRQAIRF